MMSSKITSSRRNFMVGLGAGLFSLLASGQPRAVPAKRDPFTQRPPHFLARARRVIFLHMAGSPSQLELFDYKPKLRSLDGKPCPDSLLKGKRFAFIEGVPDMLAPLYGFKRHGESGAQVSELLPNLSKIVDKICFLKAMHSDEFNHAPAQFSLYTGFPRPGRPSMGSWVSYGLGSANPDLPSYMVLLSGQKIPSGGKSLWGSGFLPSVYQGVQLRSQGDPVVYLSNPEGLPRRLQRESLDAINRINRKHFASDGNPEIETRISQFELAYRMQSALPEVMDLAKEPQYIKDMYGLETAKSGFARNCLLARRLVENGVRFVQLFDWGWDNHGTAMSNLESHLPERCFETDRPMTALILDLEQRGLLEDTLVVWGGEFGRTPMRENRGGKTMKFVGRDHHKECFTMWMAGGGVKPGISYGETDEIGYYGVKDRLHIHDLQATILHLLGFDHERLIYRFQGRDYRLTDVFGNVCHDIINS